MEGRLLINALNFATSPHRILRLIHRLGQVLHLLSGHMWLHLLLCLGAEGGHLVATRLMALHAALRRFVTYVLLVHSGLLLLVLLV